MAKGKSFERPEGVVSLDRIKGIGTVPAANSYADLRTGPQFGRAFETQPGLPIDGSKRLLRMLSPFIISIVPPLLFEQALDQTQNDTNLTEGREVTESEGVSASTVTPLTFEEISEFAALGGFNNFSEQDFVDFEQNEGSEFLAAYERYTGLSVRQLSSLTFTASDFFSSPEDVRGIVTGIHETYLGSGQSEVEYFGLVAADSEEAARLEAEQGSGQSRNDPQAKGPTIGLLEGTGARHSSFKDAKNARTRAAQQLLGQGTAGSGRNFLSAETYVSLGQERTADRNEFLEPGFADRLVAADISAQIQAMLETPPLVLLINPQSFNIQYTDIQQFSQRTRKGFLFQRWGEEQPVVTISGRIGAFIAGTSPDTGVLNADRGLPSVSGVQFASKRDSASFQNLMSLLTFYKNAGYIYDTVGGTNANHFVGSLAIEYDNWVYIGHFNSFDWGYDESATQNGGVTFNAEFTVSQMFDNHQPVENVLPLSSPTVSPSDPRWVGQTLEPSADLLTGLAAIEDTSDRARSVTPDVGGADTSSLTSVGANDQGFVAEETAPEEESTGLITVEQGVVFGPNGEEFQLSGEIQVPE